MREFHWTDFEWDPRTFPDPEGMLARLHDEDLHVCAWINPYIAQRSPLFAEARERGFLVRRPTAGVAVGHVAGRHGAGRLHQPRGDRVVPGQAARADRPGRRLRSRPTSVSASRSTSSGTTAPTPSACTTTTPSCTTRRSSGARGGARGRRRGAVRPLRDGGRAAAAGALGRRQRPRPTSRWPRRSAAGCRSR